MVKTFSIDKNGIKKGLWSQEEDNKLRAYVEKHGHKNWRQLPKSAGLARCGKSCRLRWMNYLRPGLKRGNYSTEEDEIIIELYKQHGPKWSIMAEKLPGRSDNEIKNHWHTHLSKRVNLKQNHHKTSPSPSSSSSNVQISSEINDVVNNPNDVLSLLPESSQFVNNFPLLSSEAYASGGITSSFSSSNVQISPEINDVANNPNDVYSQFVNNFPLLSSEAYVSGGISSSFSSSSSLSSFSSTVSSSGMDWILDDNNNNMVVQTLLEDPTLESFWNEPFIADNNNLYGKSNVAYSVPLFEDQTDDFVVPLFEDAWY